MYNVVVFYFVITFLVECSLGYVMCRMYNLYSSCGPIALTNALKYS
jgi:hypothetical protein